MTTDQKEAAPAEALPFQADVAKLLHLMVHSVYADTSVFLRELIANAADACERLRYEAIVEPKLLGDDVKPHITLLLDAEGKRLTVEDNGIGMSRAEEAEETALIGRFGVGFYSAFMVAGRVEVTSRRAGSDEAFLWSSDGKGTFA